MSVHDAPRDDRARTPRLGCVADDLTGATDLASALVGAGLGTILQVGVPAATDALPACDAVVVALKSRTAPVAEAVAQSQTVARWFAAGAVPRLYFKYCSTFDCRADGNIGPVIDALLALSGAHQAIVCPAYPVNGRTLYQGHLFVGDVPLAESSMRHHPLTPMMDSNIVRILRAQIRAAVELVPHRLVDAGAGELRRALAALGDRDVRCAVVDAVSNRDLATIARACADHVLLTGGSALAGAWATELCAAGVTDARAAAPPAVPPAAPAAVLAGSCSAATQAQVGIMAAAHGAFRIDPVAVAAGGHAVQAALAWALPRLRDGHPVLIHSTAPAGDVTAAQQVLGIEAAGAAVERAMATLALALVRAGAGRLIVAGGETSGAVVEALGITRLEVGAAIAPGVPWTRARAGDRELFLALKSGNFGGQDFFLEALEAKAR